MRRTEVLQEILKMRFTEAYGDWQRSRLTQEEAARLLGVSDRTFRRYISRYEDAGEDGLLDKRLNQESHRRAPLDEVMKLTEQYREKHAGWNVRHFAVLLGKYRLKPGGKAVGIQKMEQQLP